ncbi:ParA family protein [Neisseria arctica]|uniref:ParA family protein n=1 Tax=Neisseria arctica TaxID=1470200 RepID=UPI00064AC9C5|nr:ParA family protein [Neisseria arctica]UOO87665.1 ParA family protein [Neisseria arctica]
MTAPFVLTSASTKGGVGKTTIIANLSAVLADIGMRVLMIDADIQPSLSRYYQLHQTAPCGLVELLFDEPSESSICSTISSTIYPNLDIVLTNAFTADLQNKISSRLDGILLLKNKLRHPYFAQNYDVILIDTQGASGPLQETAFFASSCLLAPIMPTALSAREFNSGTDLLYQRLEQGRGLGLEVPPMRAVICGKDRTRDAREITEEIQRHFNRKINLAINSSHQLLDTIVPYSKAYKEAATRRVPVHCHERTTQNKESLSAYDTMHALLYELFPALKESNYRGSCFNDMTNLLLPEETKLEEHGHD